MVTAATPAATFATSPMSSVTVRARARRISYTPAVPIANKGPNEQTIRSVGTIGSDVATMSE